MDKWGCLLEDWIHSGSQRIQPVWERIRQVWGVGRNVSTQEGIQARATDSHHIRNHSRNCEYKVNADGELIASHG